MWAIQSLRFPVVHHCDAPTIFAEGTSEMPDAFERDVHEVVAGVSGSPEMVWH